MSLQVWSGGYEWVEVAKRSYLVARPDAAWPPKRRSHQTLSRSLGWLEYDPASMPLLFQEFRRLPLTKDAILRFANTYGQLGPLKPVVGDRWGDSFRDWKKEIEAHDRIWRLCRELQKKPVDKRAVLEQLDALEEFAAVLDFIEHGPKTRSTLPAEAMLAARELGSTFAVPGTQSPAWRARWAIAYYVNRRLSARVTLQTSKERLELNTDSSTLLGAVWLQLAKAATGVREWRTCPNCDRDFPIGGPDGKRSHGEYDSNKCRVAAWRRSKNEEAAK